MKKKLISLMSIFAILLGLTSAMAYGDGETSNETDGVYQGKIHYVYGLSPQLIGDTEATLVKEGDKVTISFTTSEGEEMVVVSTYKSSPIYPGQTEEFTTVNGVVYSDIGFAIPISGNKATISGKVSVYTFYLWIEGTFEKKADLTPQNRSASFSAANIQSDTGQYTLSVAGYLEREVTEGENPVPAAEIKNNAIAIVAHNNKTGANRTMNASTIEEMTIVVRGGKIAEIRIRGRVQTSPGTLDRYTVNIPV